MPLLSIRELGKRLGGNDILRDLNLTVEEGEIIALLGPSGSGKTTLLRCISGLEDPDSGSIHVRERPFFDGERDLHLPTEQRNLGLVFQSYALWPHRTIEENVSFGLEMRGMPKAQISERVAAALGNLGLGALAKRYPNELSGGQQQRVALARAFVTQPDLLLLDEPLSNLDAKLREYARVWLRDELKAAGITAVFVTHDQAEAMAVADRIAILSAGRLEQIGTPSEIYGQPKTLLVADFMGSPNILTGAVTASGPDGVVAQVEHDSISGTCPASLSVGARCKIVLRPEHLRLAPDVIPPAHNLLTSRVTRSVYFGTHWEHWVDVAGQEVRFNSPEALGRNEVRLVVPVSKTLFFPEEVMPQAQTAERAGTVPPVAAVHA